MVSRRRLVSSAAVGALVLAFILPGSALARGNFTMSGCYSVADDTETFTISWTGVVANGYSFGATDTSTGEGLAFIQPITPSRSGTETWSIGGLGENGDATDLVLGGIELGNTSSIAGHYQTVASGEVELPFGGWTHLPAC